MCDHIESVQPLFETPAYDCSLSCAHGRWPSQRRSQIATQEQHAWQRKKRIWWQRQATKQQQDQDVADAKTACWRYSLRRAEAILWDR
jgi:hypothetical protein